MRSGLAVLFAAGLLLASGCSAGAPGPATVQAATTATVTEPGHVGQDRMEYQLVPGAPAEDTASRPDTAPIRLLGRGTSSRIVDRDGTVVRDGRSGASIYGLELNPSQNMALIYFGDAEYAIASVGTPDDASALPTIPPGLEDATGFTWHWLDDAHLLGEAHLPPADVAGRTASEIDALPPAAVLLYVYSVEDRHLASVETSDDLPRLFQIHATSGWNLTLLTLGEDAERSLGATIERTPRPAPPLPHH
ncbi:hypothetical protein ACW7GZ_10540 [Luteimonas sp. A537]